MKIDNEAELLNMFCDETHIKSVLRAPFYNTNFNEVWSTDGRVLIRINPKVIIKEYPKHELRFLGLECPCKKIVSIEAINKALETCPKVDEEIVVRGAVECEECSGTGEVYWEYTDNRGHTHEHEFDCPVCDGTGESTHQKIKKTGKQIIKEDAVINIGNAYFFAKNICKLKAAMDFLEITSVELVFNHHRNASEFVIDGDIRIEIMPIFFDHTRNCDAVLELK